MKIRRILLVVGLCSLMALLSYFLRPSPIRAAENTRVVTTTASSGPGSLFEAIATSVSGDVIRFDTTVFPPINPTRIVLQNHLGAVSVDHVTIDASDAGVIIDGNANTYACMEISGATGVIIQGLSIENCLYAGMAIYPNENGSPAHIVIGGDPTEGAGPNGRGNRVSNSAGGISFVTGSYVTVTGNIVGLDATGTVALPNTSTGIALTGTTNIAIYDNVVGGNAVDGIIIQNSVDGVVLGNFVGTNRSGTAAVGNQGAGIIIENNTNMIVGGTTLDKRNIVSGNKGVGISVAGGGSANIVIQGNYIGTDVTGSQAISNQIGIGVDQGATGVLIGGSANNAGNLVSGNDSIGINILTNNNTVQGNYIGTDTSGQSTLPNGVDGINIDGSNNLIGGASSNAGNVVSGNGITGIGMDGLGITPISNNTIEGNIVGLTADGLQPLPNTRTGILAVGQNHTIRNNIVSGNGEDGIVLGPGEGDYVTQNNVVTGNIVGLDTDRLQAIPNGDNGVALWKNATDNTIIDNEIAFNRELGIFLTADGGTGNILRQNNIHDNARGPIRVSINTTLDSNQVSRNADNRIELFSDVPLIADQTIAPQGEASQFLLYRNCTTCYIRVPSARTLTVEAGSELFVDYLQAIHVTGTLDIVGTASAPVTIVGTSDMSWRGDWLGIKLFSSGGFRSTGPFATLNMAHAQLSFAQTAVHVTHLTQATIQNSTLAASSEVGLKVEDGGFVTLTNNRFIANEQFDIQGSSFAMVDASGSWWGDASGAQPSKISGNVNTSNPRTAPSDVNQEWVWAETLNLGNHTATISSTSDFDWYKFPIPRDNQTMTVTLTALPADYDVYLFAHLSGNANRNIADLAAMSALPWLSRIDDLQPNGELEALPWLSRIGGLFANSPQPVNLGQLVAASTNADTENETMSLNVGDQVGWYYVLVAGNDGAFDAVNPYTLMITATESVDLADGASVPIFRPITGTVTAQTIFLTHSGILEGRYGSTQTAQLINKLNTLAQNPLVLGTIVDLADYPAIDEAYSHWANNPNKPNAANRVSRYIRALLRTLDASQPELTYLVIVGDDAVVPYRRLGDKTVVANQREYDPRTNSDSPIGAAFEKGKFLSDDYYADLYPKKWRGRRLYVPKLAVGRLVESPADMINVIDAFLLNPTVTVETSLVTGYDFLTDVANELTNVVDQTTALELINNSWVGADLRSLWFANGPELVLLNGHFTHYAAIPANYSSNDLLTPAQIISDLSSAAGSLVYSIGCQSGLCIPDEQVTMQSAQYQTDFCQAFAAHGASYIANTAFAYGDGEVIAYSEQIALNFANNARAGQTLGQALANAKRQYMSDAGISSFGPYDEKVVAQVTLYGLPMARVQIPAGQRTNTPTNDPCTLAPSLTGNAPQRQQLNCTLSPHRHDLADGSYFSINGTTQSNHGMPIQPRTLVPLPQDNNVAHGILFLGGSQMVETPFDPLITRVITDGSLVPSEPAYTIEQWSPAVWSHVASENVNDTLVQEVVIMGGQYFPAVSRSSGTQRTFTDMQFEVLYSDSTDFYPPNITNVNSSANVDNCLTITTNATDASNVAQVLLTYREEGQSWRTLSLTQSENDWSGTLNHSTSVEYFIQAVDEAGNVAISHNKGRYYHYANNCLVPTHIELSQQNTPAHLPVWLVLLTTTILVGAFLYLRRTHEVVD